jgi:hypothetical protein
MKEKMKIFTIKSGEVEEGARVDSLTLKGAGVSIPAIIIGEEGRGRELGVLPVQLLPEQYKEWQENGYTHIRFAEIGTTKAGKPKLFQTEEVDTTEKCICVFWTMIGVRGSNSHTGDLKDEYWVPHWSWKKDVLALGEEKEKEKYTKEEAISIAKRLDSSEPWDNIMLEVIFENKVEFHPFPGEILCKGVIAHGMAGRAASGEQLVAIMPANTVFRTGYSGRLYGAPAAHYYIFRDGELLSVTWKEREISDIF